jgi:hypothetical protein
MKLKVELTWWNGIVAEGESAWSEPEYELVDADSGRILADQPFKSCVELEKFIATRYPDAERWIPPLPTPVDAAKVERVFGLIEKLPPDQFNPQATWPFLIAQLYQSSYPPESVERIRKVLGLPV